MRVSVLPGYQLLSYCQSDQLPRLLHIVRLHTLQAYIREEEPHK